MGFGVWGLGFGAWGLRFGFEGLGFGVWGSDLQQERLAATIYFEPGVLEG